MFTFITIVSTPCDKAAGRDTITVRKPFASTEKVVAKMEMRALTAQQAEAQALKKMDLTVRNAFGAVIEDAEVNVTTIRKFAVEVERKV